MGNRAVWAVLLTYESEQSKGETSLDRDHLWLGRGYFG